MWTFLIILGIVAFQTVKGSAIYNPSSRCPRVDGPNSVYFPGPNCSTFYQCSNGVAYIFTCPANLHFNPKLNVCDYPYKAGCQGPTNGLNRKAYPLSRSTPSEKESCKRLSLLCPAINGEDSVYIALANCSAFCQCSNGVAYYQPCPKGLYFNPTLNVCDYPYRAGCTGEPGTTPTTKRPSYPQPTAASSTVPPIKPSPSPTVYPPSSDAPSNRPSCKGLSYLCPPIGVQKNVYISLANCSAFCQCSNGVAYYQPCPKGTHFNPTLNVCDYPANAGCTGKIGTTPTYTRPSYPSIDAALPAGNPSPSITPSQKESCKKLSSQCPAIDGKDSVYIALANNCSAFCQCSNGVAYYQPCPKGLNFNRKLNVCDYPYRAGCTGKYA